MAGEPGRAVTSADADRQWTATRQVFQDEQYNAVQSLFWQHQRPKRSAPTPCQSNLTTPQEAAQDAAHMEVEAELAEDKPQPVSFLQPFSRQDEAALSTTVAELGVNVADHNAVQQWLQKPVGTNQDMFAVIRAYHEKVVARVLLVGGAAGGRAQEPSQRGIPSSEEAFVDDCREPFAAKVHRRSPAAHYGVAARHGSSGHRVYGGVDVDDNAQSCYFLPGTWARQ